MDPQLIADAYAKRGVDTFEEIDYLIALQIYQAQVLELDRKIALNNSSDARAAALKAITDADLALRNERAAVIEQIGQLVPPAK